MTEIIPNNAEPVLNKLMKLFGYPPLLRNERLEDFKEVFQELYAALGPDDFLMDVHVYHFAIETWRMYRLMRYEAAILNKHESNQRAAWAEDGRKETIAQGMKEIREKFPRVSDAHPQYLSAVAELKTNANAEYRDNLNSASTDLDYIEAFEHSTARLERIETRISRAFKQRENILRQIALSRLVLSKKLRKMSDRIIEGAVLEAATASNAQLISQAGFDGQAK